MSNLVPVRTAVPAVVEPTGNSWVDLVAPAAELARQIAGTDFVPKGLRSNPAAVTACILYGAELGLGPMQSLAKIVLVEGRPAPYAELARALVLGAGHDMWTEEQSNTRVTVAGRRRGSDKVERVTWTMDDAKRAGLGGRQMYAKFPRQMLYARASADLARMIAPDALGGIAAFAEEIDSDDDTTPAVPVEDKPNTTKRRRSDRPAPPPIEDEPLPAAEEQPPLPDEVTDGPEPITDPQTRKLMATLGEIGVKKRDERLALCSALAGRDITSSSELTKVEASMVIDRLQKVADGQADLVVDEAGVPVGIAERSAAPTDDEPPF